MQVTFAKILPNSKATNARPIITAEKPAKRKLFLYDDVLPMSFEFFLRFHVVQQHLWIKYVLIQRRCI
jgi:hypothetical protein